LEVGKIASLTLAMTGYPANNKEAVLEGLKPFTTVFSTILSVRDDRVVIRLPFLYEKREAGSSLGYGFDESS